MIQMTKYSRNFEQAYMNKVLSLVDQALREQIVRSMREYFPKDFLDTEDNTEKYFRKLILAEYGELKEIHRCIKNLTLHKMHQECFGNNGEMTRLYQDYYKKYPAIRDSFLDGQKMNVKIVYESGMWVCPYCNRDYINSRGDRQAGAQLDHFYPRSKYPVFSLCLYNLIPVCATCNHIKGEREEELCSPFDASVEPDRDLTFVYSQGGPEEYDSVHVDMKYTNTMKANIELFRLKDAYMIHDKDVRELLKKRDIYVKSQLDELGSMLKSGENNISVEEIKEIIFGARVKPEQYGKKPLSKLRGDILKSFEEIYPGW